MAQLYDGTDIMWSNTGDLVIGHEGDIASTVFDPLLAVAQDIYDRCKSDSGDFSESPLVGASLSEFAGEPNNRENGRRIRERIFGSMQAYGVISLQDISVDVYPISSDRIAISLQLRVAPSVRNRNSKLLQRTIIYDYAESHIVPRD